VAGKSISQRGMEEAAENGKELSHSAHGSGMNEWLRVHNKEDGCQYRYGTVWYSMVQYGTVCVSYCNFNIQNILYHTGECGGAVVEALRYKPEDL
jgi:hypothetical protein